MARNCIASIGYFYDFFFRDGEEIPLVYQGTLHPFRRSANIGEFGNGTSL